MSPFFVIFLCVVLALAPASAQTKPKSTQQKTKPNPAPSTKKGDSLVTKESSAQLTPNPPNPTAKPAQVSSIATSDLKDFDRYDPKLQSLIEQALALTKKNLTYKFGSSDPKLGGMDCSGTMYYLLREHGHYKDVPRQSDQICEWSMKTSTLYRTENVHKFDHSAMSALKPGDLLYWSGTYEPTQQRKTPITHVMLYLGILKSTGKPVVFGASDGRVYQGKSQNGVSVFDFSLPKQENKAKFYGYAPLRDPFSSLAGPDKSR